MSDWRTTELFIERSNAQHSAYAVGVAIAACGNRKDDGWTFVSLDRIAKLARVDRKTANQAINELAASGELEYVPGRSRHNPSRYRIRVEVLRDRGIDRFRCPLTMDESPIVTVEETPTVTMENSPADHGDFVANYGRIDHATMGESSTPSVNRSDNRSIDQSLIRPALTSWKRTEADDLTLRQAFDQCRLAAGLPERDQATPETASG